LSQEGTLFISLALFSEFDCKKPVFTEKIIGPWQKRDELFPQAAALMEDTVAQIIDDPESGDSFDPVDQSVPQKKWEQIGFALPPAPKVKTARPSISAVAPQKWVLRTPGPDDPPMILFRFPAPLDSYAGEVKSGRGNLSLPENRLVEGTRGFVEIDTRTAITMGDPRLDEAIQGSMMLYTKKFPTATFKIEKVTGDGQPIAYSRLSPATVEGTFELKGKPIPLTSVIEIEPILDEAGKPRLLINGTFKIDLRTFDIEGADGPAPARHTLLFDLNFVLQENLKG
ncbi:MAG: YceI family protein, partial [Deltaproteobacteria bacterium]|nr:YceI family protein [Deltaproteobacteria bacterium]